MLSFWEKESFINYDIIIVGSGIVGLSTAISIKNKHPEKSVLVLERGILPTGASTRNAGFTTFGGIGELLHDLKIMEPERVFNLVRKRWEGLRLLRERLGDDTIEYKNYGGCELIFNNEEIGIHEIQQLNQFLEPLFRSDTFSVDNTLINKYGFNKNFIKLCIFSPFEGQLHTGKMMRALLQMAMQKNIEIKTGANVLNIENTNSCVAITVKNETLNNSIVFQAEQCVVCTNAFTNQFFPELDITPGRGQVLVTEPIPNLPFKGIFHFDEGYYYFRNIGNRILFGGGRNLDFEKEKTTKIELNNTIQKKLDYYLKNLIIPKLDYSVDQRWSGIMAFGKDKEPIIKRINERILIGVRMNGIGVALGTMVGEELAGMV